MAGDSYIDERLIKSVEACLVQGYMHAVAGLKAERRSRRRSRPLVWPTCPPRVRSLWSGSQNPLTTSSSRNSSAACESRGRRLRRPVLASDFFWRSSPPGELATAVGHGNSRIKLERRCTRRLRCTHATEPAAPRSDPRPALSECDEASKQRAASNQPP